MASPSSLTTNQPNKEVTMPELSEIKGKLNVDGLVCSLAINQAIEELKNQRECDDEESKMAIAVLENLLFSIIESIEPIEE